MIRWLSIHELEQARLDHAIAEAERRAEWRPKQVTVKPINEQVEVAMEAMQPDNKYKPPMAICPKCLRNVLCIGGKFISHRINEGAEGEWCVNNQSL